MKASESFNSLEYCDASAISHLCSVVSSSQQPRQDETVRSSTVCEDSLFDLSSIFLSKKKSKPQHGLQSRRGRLITKELGIWNNFRKWEKKVKRKGASPDVAMVRSGGFDIKLPVTPLPYCAPSSTSLISTPSDVKWGLWRYDDIKSSGYGTPQWDAVCVKRRPDYRCCNVKASKSSVGENITTTDAAGLEIGYGPAEKNPFKWKPSESSLDETHPVFGDSEHLKAIENDIFPNNKNSPSRRSKASKSIKKQTGVGKDRDQKFVQLWPQKEPTDATEEDHNDDAIGRYSKLATRDVRFRSPNNEQPSARNTTYPESTPTEKQSRMLHALQESFIKEYTRDTRLISASDLLIDMPNQSTDGVFVDDITMVAPLDGTQPARDMESTEQQQLVPSWLDAEKEELRARRREMAVVVDNAVDALESTLVSSSDSSSEVDTPVSDSTPPSYVEEWEPEEERAGFWELNITGKKHAEYSSSQSISSDVDPQLLAYSDEEDEVSGATVTMKSCSNLKEEMSKVMRERAHSGECRESCHLQELKKFPSARNGVWEQAPNPCKSVTRSLPNVAAVALKGRETTVAGGLMEEMPVLDVDLGAAYTSIMLRLHTLAWNVGPQVPPSPSAFSEEQLMVAPIAEAVDAKKSEEEEIFHLRDKADKLLGPDRRTYIDIFQGDTNVILRTVDGHLIVVDVEVAKQLNLYKYEIESVGVQKFVNTVRLLPPLPLESFILVLLWSSHFQADELPYESSSEESLLSDDSDIFSGSSDLEKDDSPISYVSVLSVTSSDAKPRKKRKKKTKKKKMSTAKEEIEEPPPPPKEKVKVEIETWFRDDRKDPRVVLQDDPPLPDDKQLPLDGLVLLHALLRGGEGVGGRLRNLLRAAEALGATSLRDAVLRMVARSATDFSAHDIKAMLNPVVQESYLPHYLVEAKGDVAMRLSSQRRKRYVPNYMLEYRMPREPRPASNRTRRGLKGNQMDSKASTDNDSLDSFDSDDLAEKSTPSRKKFMRRRRRK